jgi:CHASE3 domain sensor protein
MNAHIKHSIIPLLVVLMLSICILSVQEATAQTDQITSRLQVANTAVNQAFNAVLDAEKAGANVTDIMFRLNYAMGILAQAENSNRTGYFNRAATQADSILPLAQQITTTAQNAKQTAIVSNQNTFWSTITLTAIGVFVFFLVLFLIWRLLKRKYIKGLSEAKPEVVKE